MSDDWRDWEGVARDFHDSTGVDDPPVDGHVLAKRARLRVEYGPGSSSLDLIERKITVNPRQLPRDLHIDLAHEVGHALMIRAGMQNLEAGAKYLSGALLGPRRHIDRDVDRTNWSVPALQSVHRNMPSLALALRITQVRDAVATIFHPTQRMDHWRRASPWITDPAITENPTRLERAFAMKAWNAGTELHGDELHKLYGDPTYRGLHATIVLDEYEDGPRVIVVRDLRQLNLRFTDG